MRRAQVTLFIIIGVIILFGVGITLYLKNLSIESKLDVNVYSSVEDVKKSVKGSIQSCLNDELENAIILFGSHGTFVYPYFDMKQLALVDGSHVVFLFSEKTNFFGNALQSKERTSFQIGYHLKRTVEDCARIQDYSSLGWGVEDEPIHYSVSLNSEDVSVKFFYPMYFSREDSSFQVSEFSISNPTRLSLIIDKIDFIIRDVSNAQKTLDDSLLQPGVAKDAVWSAISQDFCDMVSGGENIDGIRVEKTCKPGETRILWKVTDEINDLTVVFVTEISV